MMTYISAEAPLNSFDCCLWMLEEPYVIISHAVIDGAESTVFYHRQEVSVSQHVLQTCIRPRYRVLLWGEKTLCGSLHIL